MGGVRCLGLFPKKNRFFFLMPSLNGLFTFHLSLSMKQELIYESSSFHPIIHPSPERAHCLPKVPFARSWILLEGVLGSTYFEFQPVLLGCLGEISFFVFFSLIFTGPYWDKRFYRLDVALEGPK